MNLSYVLEPFGRMAPPITLRSPDGSAGCPWSWLATAAAASLIAFFVLNFRPGRKRLPGPWWTIPFFGETIELASSDPLKFLWKRFKRYGRVFRVSLLGFEVYAVADPEALRPVLSDEAALYTMPAQSFNWLMGRFSFMDKKDIHGPWRKLQLSVVSGAGLKKMLPRVRRVVEGFVRQWESKGRLEIFEAARVLGLDLAVLAITGVDLEGVGVDIDWFRGQMSVFLAGLFGLPLALPGSQLAKALAAKERLLDALEPVLRERHEAISAEWEASGRDFNKAAARMAESEDFTLNKVQMLGLRAIGAESLRDTAMSVLHIVMTSADTTRFALFNTWALLAQLPAVQDKAYEEQKKVVAEFGPEISFQALSNMPYLEAVFKEAMRILSAVSGGFRRLTRDLTVGDVTLPAGTTVWYNAWLLHQLDPALWDGDTSGEVASHMDWHNNLAGVFQPERWLGDEAKRPRSFYNFGGGAHLCAGMQLVLMEEKLLLAMLLRRHRLELEVPDMLARAEKFPIYKPVKGTDGVRLLPREEPIPWA